MSPKITPNAPRFHTLLQKMEGRPVFIIRRLEWEKLQIEEGKLVALNIADLALFPFSLLSTNEDYLGTIATKNNNKIKITLYRFDSKDEPTPINVDFYSVWESIPPNYNIDEMITMGDTDNDQNFQDYLTEHVFLVKENVVEGHWLTQLPKEIAVLLEQAV
jgi:hypothetical protein